LHTRYSEAPKKLLIVGGGFGGLAVLEGLVEALDRDEEVGVALLDRVNYHHLLSHGPVGGLTPFRYRPLGQLVDLGTESALTDILGIRISGRLAAYVWRAVYPYELGHNLNRVRVLMDWVMDLLIRPDTSKLYEDHSVYEDDSGDRSGART
jgi:NADH dehydrogenase FAD-containing subunit